MFADVIREAGNEHEIYFLLTSYVEAVRFGDQLNLVPEPVKRLPLEGNNRVREQYQELVAALDKATQNRNENACVVIREALPIFSAALDRLESMTHGDSARRKREPREYASEARNRPQPGA